MRGIHVATWTLGKSKQCWSVWTIRPSTEENHGRNLDIMTVRQLSRFTSLRVAKGFILCTPSWGRCSNKDAYKAMPPFQAPHRDKLLKNLETSSVAKILKIVINANALSQSNPYSPNSSWIHSNKQRPIWNSFQVRPPLHAWHQLWWPQRTLLVLVPVQQQA